MHTQLPHKTSSAHSPGEQDQNVFVSFPQVPIPLLPLSFPAENWLPTKNKFLRQTLLNFLTFHHLHLPLLEEDSSQPLNKNSVPSKTWPYSSPKPSGLTANSFFLCYKHASHLKTASFTFTSNYLSSSLEFLRGESAALLLLLHLLLTSQPVNPTSVCIYVLLLSSSLLIFKSNTFLVFLQLDFSAI